MRIVYQSYEGRYSDSPRVLHGALADRYRGAEHVWLADPAHKGDFPPGVLTARYASEEARGLLESADLLVANTHTDFDWDKTDRTLYLQTWHGTPLKRIHWDVLWAPEGRLARLSRDVERWDYLVSPNRASTPRLRAAFRYDGEVIETGYPRNDVLTSPQRHEVRARVRGELEIGEGTTAVLYAPTWRDDVVFPEGGKEFALGLGVDEFTRALGSDHCLMLRLHYMLTERMQAVDDPAVREVSRHPDVAELYLAADVLVTDYSSAMFDFAVTSKPILLLAEDLDDYSSRLRGFYFDLAAAAPGPLLTSTAELIGALRDLRGVQERHADHLRRFRDTFCHLEDGHATDRVLDRIMPAIRAVQDARPGFGSRSA